MTEPGFLFDGPAASDRTVVLAHGAGQAMDAPFMNAMASGLADRGLRVARFEFPYMAATRKTGKRKPPDRQPVLIETWTAVIETLGPADRLVIGGKSMGGRMASMVADRAGVAGLVCLGYPFHPPGKPERLRTEHLEALRTPTLILQGERDPFGGREEVAGYRLSSAIRLHWLTDGDHGFKPRKASGKTEHDNVSEAVEAFGDFATNL